MVEHLATYLNKNGYPIIRRCFNCKHWKGDIQLGGEKPMGYCKVEAMYFAFTLQPTVYPITKDFYLCQKHEFENEEKLKESSVMVSLKDSLKKKSDIL
jgi:hypothetical protein